MKRIFFAAVPRFETTIAYLCSTITKVVQPALRREHAGGVPRKWSLPYQLKKVRIALF